VVRHGTIQPGQKYHFRLVDVICPDQHEVRMQVTSDLEVSGEVVFLSDSGGEKESFAVVEVAGIGSPLIIPVERLRPVPDTRVPDQEAVPVRAREGLQRTPLGQ